MPGAGNAWHEQLRDARQRAGGRDTGNVFGAHRLLLGVLDRWGRRFVLH
jgi:hypothetical protein